MSLAAVDGIGDDPIAAQIIFKLQVMRDIQRSGQAAGEVIQQVSETVFPMYKAFIEPDLNNAEIKVTNNFNPFAGFKEPIQILKTDDSCSVDAAYDVLKDLYPNEDITRVRLSKLNFTILSCTKESR